MLIQYNVEPNNAKIYFCSSPIYGLNLNMFRVLILAISVTLTLCLNSNYLALSLDSLPAENSNQKLSELETRFFEHPYSTESDSDRINRIEQFIFGCTETGSVNDRLQHILSTIPAESAKPLSDSDSQSTEQSKTDNNPENLGQNSARTDYADQPSEDNSSNKQYSSYPRVTSLEQELLGHKL